MAPAMAPGERTAPAVPRGHGHRVARLAVAGLAVVGIGVGGFLAAQYFFGDEPEPQAAGTATTTLALPAEVAGLTRVSGPAAAEAVTSQLGYPLRNTPTLGTGAYGKAAQGPGTMTAMMARTAAPPAAEQFASYESRSGNKVGKPRSFGQINCAPVAKNTQQAGGSVCLWSAGELRGQVFVAGAKPKAAAAVTAEMVAAVAGPSASPTP